MTSRQRRMTMSSSGRKSKALPILVHGLKMERSCGSCSLCCTVMGIMELGKPDNQRCPKLNDIGRCTIYPTRPEECRSYSCMWRAGLLPKHLSPERIHAVCNVSNDGKILVFNIDTRFPYRHKKGPLFDFIEEHSQDFMIMVVQGDERLIFCPEEMHDEVEDRLESAFFIERKKDGGTV